ncbi:V-type ATP synthase subunit D [Rubritalea tangerina]|uniref:V-type ATP synthase subunit D n=1 Tax=Rubritalea tangerina TaxID=430798 RepID=A0ABW4Z7M2_9BACT
MSKLTLSKSGLQRERESLKLYRKVLPSLDLKRQQLLGEHKKAEREYQELLASFEPYAREVAERVPMLASPGIDLSQYISLKDYQKGEENIVGVKVPSLDSLEFELVDYAYLGTPHWFDHAIEALKQFTELKIRAQIAGERVDALYKAARKITQRVNLFDKILIPRAEANIKKIQIHLADAERSAVVQSKLAKAKSHRITEALKGGGV